MNARIRLSKSLTNSVRAASALALLILAACSRVDSGVAAAPQIVPVSVMEAKSEQVPFSLEVAAQAEGSKEVEVRARIGGILVKRFYQEGAPVKAGQPLFEIDRVPHEIALAQAKGQLDEKKARAEQAKREAARLKDLLAQRAISQKEYDDASANNAVAVAGLDAAEAAVRQAALNLSYATVMAPAAGVSGRAEYSEGTLINNGSLLTTIVQASPVWVRFGIAEADLAALRGKMKNPRAISRVEALLPDGTAYARLGRINFESAEIDRRLGTMALRAEFDNPDGELVPGQFVRIRLLAGQRNAILVPQTAVLQKDRGTVVFVVDGDGKAQPRPIKTDGWFGANWVVSSGVQPGDKIILNNLLKLKPGVPVKIDNVPAASQGQATPAAKQ